MHKYKVTFFVGQEIKFKSKHHISNMEAMPTNKGSYVHFDDARIVLDLSQVKTMEINSIRYKMLAYQV